MQYKQMLLSTLCVILMWVTSLHLSAQNASDNYGIKNVLYISSNHDTYFASSEILAGVTNYFKEHQQKIDIKTIYLNSRYVDSREVWRSTVVTEMNKLINKQIDLLIVAGPEAISIIDSLDDPRLRSTPTIYCGTMALKDSRRSNITGVLFNYRYDEVLSIAETMYPNLENIYLVADKSSYSNELIQVAQQQLARFAYKYNIIINTDLSNVNHVMIYLKSLPRNSFVFMMNWQRTSGGDFCDWTIYYPLFAQNCTAPMYRNVKYLETEEYAIAPNKFLYKHGREVGAMGLRILKGALTTEMPISTPRIEWAISEKWINKEGINSKQISKKAIIIKEKVADSTNHALTLSLLVVLAIPILILISQLLVKRKRLKEDGETIKILKNEVSNVMNQFDNEHTLLSGVMKGVQDGIIIIENDTFRVVSANTQAATLLNLALKEVIGRKIEEVMSMRQGDIAVDVKGYARAVVTTGKKIDFLANEVVIVCRNGKRMQCDGSFSLLSRSTADQNINSSAILLIIRDMGVIKSDHLRINDAFKILKISTWSFHITSQIVTFQEGNDPLSRPVGATLMIESWAQFVADNQRRDFHAFWTDLVRSEQIGLTLNLQIDFTGSGHYEWWQLIGFSNKEAGKQGANIYGLIRHLHESENQIVEDTTDTIVPIHSSEQSASNRDFQKGPATILIAEDNDSNYLLMSKLLNDRYRLLRAKNGEQAILIAQKEHPDLILMDMNMPIMDGATATRKIRTTDRETPIYALTASIYDSDKRKTYDAGCTGYLSKPINKAALFRVLKQYCGY